MCNLYSDFSAPDWINIHTQFAGADWNILTGNKQPQEAIYPDGVAAGPTRFERLICEIS
jgi:hypothetical protein